jgi:serine/threonine-protein kinase
MPDTELAAGHVVSGRYRLVTRLGAGGMGAVWLADHVTLRSQVAIKLLHRTVLDSEDGLKRFLREAQAAAMLRSPHVVQILDHGVDEGVPYIAMELLDGESLAARLARASTLSLGEIARLVTHVARAIGKAHDAGIVHRDLKPDNIFIVRNDDEEMVKVLDFGIAKMEPALAEPAAKISTREGSLLGTPHYMSPEQVRGYAIDWRSDLWSLAIIAFECACGRVPFDGRSVGDLLVVICSEPLPVPSTLRPLPPAFDAWFARAAARDVEARFQSAKEMAEALRAAIGDEARPATSFGVAPPAKEAEVRPSHETPRLDTGTPIRHDAPTLDAAVAGEVRSTSRDPEAARAELEQARTVAPGSTKGGPLTSPAIPAPRLSGRSLRLLTGAVVAGALGVAVWLGLAGRGSAVTAGSATEAPPPPPPAPEAPAAHDGGAPAPRASSATPEAPPSATPATAASMRGPAPSAKGPTPAPPRAKQPSKSDELVF